MPVAVSAEANVAALGKADAAALRKPGGGSAVIEVVLRNGRVLRLPDDVAPARVIALADALEGIGR